MVQFVTGGIYGYSGVALPLLMSPQPDGLISTTAEESLFGELQRNAKCNIIVDKKVVPRKKNGRFFLDNFSPKKLY